MIPPEQARVDTMSIRRSQGHLRSALSAFLAVARPTPVPRENHIRA
jgi:hypothetical protein